MSSRWKRFQYRRVQRRLAGPKLLSAFAASYPEAYFVEIGANDGAKYDQLRPHIGHGWRGIMVEPVPHVFARLQANYGAVDGVLLENAAIAAVDGELPFFHPREDASPGLPDWYDAIGSFDREAVLSHADAIPDIAERLVSVTVPALTFASLLAQHGVSSVDLVLVDTEGYDWEVVRSIDLAAVRPRLVVYEHYHLSAEDQAAALAHLRGAGYETLEEGFDTFALDPIEDSLTQRFRRLRPGVPGVAKRDEAPVP